MTPYVNQSFHKQQNTQLTSSKAWLALQEHHTALKGCSIQSLFANNPQRFDEFSLSMDGLLFDFSKNLANTETLKLLVDLAKQEQLQQKIEAMFSAKRINNTENRAVLHVASRADVTESVVFEDRDVVADVHAELVKMRDFIKRLDSGALTGYSGKPFTDVINVGVGGSDLGGVMVTQALKPYLKPSVTVHFVSTMDGVQLHDLMAELNPETTLFLMTSKSMTTIDTVCNVDTAKKWLSQTFADDSAWIQHFAAISANNEVMTNYGILPDRQFLFGDYIGGRYSVSSAIGLPIAIAIGMDNFEAMLEGMHAVDVHFKETPFEHNIPVIMALLQIWYINFYGASVQTILPYAQHLHRLPAYLTQLEMESLGKSVTQEGECVDYDTGAVIFGEQGSNGQHSFYQLLHQGTRMVMADFIAPVKGPHNDGYHQQLTLANCLAQSAALAFGYTPEAVQKELAQKKLPADKIEALLPHKIHSGDRPNNMFLIDEVTPKTLGMLIALYEHKVFVQGAVWGINAFDQWGVELGKNMASALYHVVANEEAGFDPSTNGLLKHIKRQWRY